MPRSYERGWILSILLLVLLAPPATAQGSFSIEQLRKQDVPFKQLIFPDEVHGFLLHESWLRAYRAVADFFDRRLRKTD